MPDEFGSHPPQQDLASYFEAYAKKFNLLKHIQFSTEVVAVERDAKDENWLVITKDVKSGLTKTLTFDRVAIASGVLNTKHEVHLPGQEKFKGELIHSRSFKDPAKYAGKTVMVVGIGATGADTLVFLKQAGAGKLYVSHREQFWVVSTQPSASRTYWGGSHAYFDA